MTEVVEVILESSTTEPKAFFCGGPHLCRTCWKLKQANAAEVCSETGSETHHKTTYNKVSGNIYHAVLAVPTSTPLRLEKGFIGDRITSVLYYFGVNVFAINRKYVPKSTYTVSYVHWCTFSWRVECFAQCQMAIRTLFYTGVALLCALWKPIADIVVGQLSRVKRCLPSKN